MTPTRVLICDDSALMRRTLRKIVEADPGLQVIGTARDGDDAVEKARTLAPDVVTMDINMPGTDGITALQIITDEGIAPVIMVSALTQEGAVATFQALALGAFDYVPKPGGTISPDLATVAPTLRRQIKAAARPGVLGRLARRQTRPGRPGQARHSGTTSEPLAGTGLRARPTRSRFGFKAVCIGVSTGGPKTLFEVLPALPADLPAAVFLVQHMPGPFISAYSRRIDAHCPMRCVEAAIGQTVTPGTIYLARGGHHLIPYHRADGRLIIRTPRRPETNFIPSVDVMMHGTVEVFGPDTVGVLMTGMGADGADGMVRITRTEGATIAESADSAIVFGMPAEAIARGGARIVAPCWEIANHIIAAVAGG